MLIRQLSGKDFKETGRVKQDQLDRDTFGDICKRHGLYNMAEMRPLKDMA